MIHQSLSHWIPLFKSILVEPSSEKCSEALTLHQNMVTQRNKIRKEVEPLVRALEAKLNQYFTEQNSRLIKVSVFSLPFVWYKKFFEVQQTIIDWKRTLVRRWFCIWWHAFFIHPGYFLTLKRIFWKFIPLGPCALKCFYFINISQDNKVPFS